MLLAPKAVIAGATVAIAITIAAPAATSTASASSTTTIWVPRNVCAAPRPGHVACHGIKLVKRRVPTSSLVRQAHSRVSPLVADGPVGGYTPAELAKAYAVNSGATAAATQTVAIVDAFDDPTVLSDLNTFNANYGLPAETPTSFRVVNQAGGTALPIPDTGWAGEITLDVQAVRGLCHRCKILLVEADDSSNSNIATAVNEAVAMHANEISNSYGSPENDPSNTATVIAAYNHPGIAITASTGDDGWYGWDVINTGLLPDDTPSLPASLRTVVGVGGTSLFLNSDATRASETAWNDNGPVDVYGNNLLASLGASGSGCSTTFTPPLWQQKVARYATLGCGSALRSSVDIAADADPFTGYDIAQTFGNPNAVTTPWETVGGTSLSSPLVSAMWALAGGPRGVRYPSLSLYGHFKGDRIAHTYDVTVGGTGLCSTATTTSCLFDVGGNPNTIGAGLLDCAFGASGTAILANRYQCYAQRGYDGVSGVGTPKGVTVFTPDAPTAFIKPPGTITHGVTKTFSAAGSTDPFPGGVITKYAWSWGDGHTSTGRTPTHRYATKGKRTITLTVTDNYGRSGRTSRTVTVV